jgi:hypothetical protein
LTDSGADVKSRLLLAAELLIWLVFLAAISPLIAAIVRTFLTVLFRTEL